LVFPVLGCQAALDSLLAIPQNPGVGSIHSKWPFVGVMFVVANTFQPVFTAISSVFLPEPKKSRLLRD
jgi:hypothetical protein